MKPQNEGRRSKKGQTLKSVDGLENQRDQLLDVLAEWVGNLKDGDNKTEFEEVDMSIVQPKLQVSKSPKANHKSATHVQKKHKVATASVSSSSSVASASTSASAATSVYSHSVMGTKKHSKLNKILLKIGLIVKHMPDLMAPADITSRSTISDLLGPLELQAQLYSILNLKLDSKEIQVLMKRFGTSGVSGDRVDLHELVAWAKSVYRRHHDDVQYETFKKRTKDEVAELFARNHVLSKVERNRVLEEEFQKKIDLKLSLAALTIVSNDKFASILEDTDECISIPEFKALLPKLDLFLSNLEQAAMFTRFAHSDYPGTVDFDAFRMTLVMLAKESIRMVHQDEAVESFKSVLARGQLPSTVHESSEEGAGDYPGLDDLSAVNSVASIRGYVGHVKAKPARLEPLHAHPSHYSHSHSHSHSHSSSDPCDVVLLPDDSLSIAADDTSRVSHRPSPAIHHRTHSQSQSQAQPQLPPGRDEGEAVAVKPVKPSVGAVMDWMSDPLDGAARQKKKPIVGQQQKLAPLNMMECDTL